MSLILRNHKQKHKHYHSHNKIARFNRVYKDDNENKGSRRNQLVRFFGACSKHAYV